MQRLFELLLRFVEKFFTTITFVGCCNKGYNLIRKTCGIPGKIYKKPGIAFKIPLFQTYDVINMKKQVHFLNAHSVKSKNDKVIPYNITVDAQVEFRIIDPFVIYHIDTFDEGNREPIRIYVDNEVHLLINSIIDYDITAEEAQRLIDEKLAERNKNQQDYFQQAILIERIIISAFDYNLSLRHAQ